MSGSKTHPPRRGQRSLFYFFIGSLLIGLGGHFYPHDLMPNFREQRPLASFPSFKRITDFLVLPDSLTKYSADNFGFRKPLLSAYFYLRLKVLHSDIGLPAVIGKDGWLFFKDEVSSYRHQNLLNSDQLDNIKTRLDAWCNYTHDNGAEFIFFVGPNKSTIYKDKMPVSLAPIGTSSLLDQVYAIKFECPFIKVDLRPTLEKNNKEVLYYKWGTHWNDRAAQLAWIFIKDKVNHHSSNITWPAVQSVITYRQARPLEDSMWSWFGQNDPTTENLPKIDILETPEISKQGQSARMLVFGDSFVQFMQGAVNVVANGASFWWLTPKDEFSFQPTDLGSAAWLISGNGLDKPGLEIMKTFKPNLVMLEVVERNLSSLANLPLPKGYEYTKKIQEVDFLGSWVAGVGKGSIRNNNDKTLLISNERNEFATGHVSGNSLVVPGWGVTGLLSADRQTLTWSNGVIWHSHLSPSI